MDDITTTRLSKVQSKPDKFVSPKSPRNLNFVEQNAPAVMENIVKTAKVKMNAQNFNNQPAKVKKKHSVLRELNDSKNSRLSKSNGNL